MINKIMSLGFSRPESEELVKVSKNIEEDYKKLLEGYPIQYLIGYVDFYGYKIYVNENVLIPRYETEYLVQKTINYSKKIFNDKLDILDLGTGSGAISIVLGRELNSIVTGVDISEDALNVAKKNAIENKVSINFIKSNMLDSVEGKYDIVVSNPPYIDIDEKIMDSVKKYEPHLALYAKDNGLYFYKNILSNIKPYLKERFIIAFEIGWWQGSLIEKIAQEYFENSNILIEKDLTNRDRYIFIINE
ncbi:MAG: peptide chain release factor N(5)-glutamine methyltransferase [Mollicutes bacterium]|nr:peptide chain release factor N(5)-glutamine methyltransferase [Mollicutes bacterium]